MTEPRFRKKLLSAYASWADWLNAQRRAGRDVYTYFNNDIGGHAPRDAVTLRELLESRT